MLRRILCTSKPFTAKHRQRHFIFSIYDSFFGIQIMEEINKKKLKKSYGQTYPKAIASLLMLLAHHRHAMLCQYFSIVLSPLYPSMHSQHNPFFPFKIYFPLSSKKFSMQYFDFVETIFVGFFLYSLFFFLFVPNAHTRTFA